MMSALYGAGASLISRQEDISSATSTLNMLVMVPYFLVVFFANNLKVLAVLSYIPFSSAIAVPMRVFLGEAATWELVAIFAINMLAPWGAGVLAPRIEQRAGLRMGRGWSWRDGLRAA